MKKEDLCPYCNIITTVEIIQAMETIKVRNEMITIPTEFLRCISCGQDFDDPKSINDPLDRAYKEYRNRHKMMQPEQIKLLRQQYDLTQKELSELLSWGEVTLNRYEKGKLQDSAHDTMLHLIKNPINMLDLINEREGILSTERKKEFVEKLTQTIKTDNPYQRILGNYESNVFSGYNKLDVAKVNGMLTFFCYPEGQFQTKLCKLAFYADALHYKERQKSITGMKYVKMPFGPVPNNFEEYKTLLIENDKLEVEEIYFNENIGGLFLKAILGPDLSVFSDEERKTLIAIKKIFAKYSSKKISDMSHAEEGYIKTPDKAFISYEYAKNLQI